MINPKRVLELLVALAFIVVSSQFANAAILWDQSPNNGGSNVVQHYRLRKVLCPACIFPVGTGLAGLGILLRRRK